MSFSTFTRPPHYQLNDCEAMQYAPAPATSGKTWVVAIAATACVMLGVYTVAQPAQQTVLYTPTQVTRSVQAPAAVPVQQQQQQYEVEAPVQAGPVRQAAVAATTAAYAMAPMAAQAAVTPSLKNLGLSVIAGGTVLGAIAVAVALVSQFDQVDRK